MQIFEYTMITLMLLGTDLQAVNTLYLNFVILICKKQGGCQLVVGGHFDNILRCSEIDKKIFTLEWFIDKIEESQDNEFLQRAYLDILRGKINELQHNLNEEKYYDDIRNIRKNQNTRGRYIAKAN